MKTNRISVGWLMLLALLTLNLHPSTAFAQGATAFTYQGQLHDTGTNANGTYTMIFALYDAAANGNQIGSAITTSATLANGLFSVNLDFGAGAFNGSARWLDITVSGETLTPRVQMLPAPYAQFAAVAASVTNGAITASAIANGAVGSTQLASNLTISGHADVGGLQIGGTNWNINVGNVTGPPGTGMSFTNALVLSANGLPYLDFVTVPGVGPVVYDPGQLVAASMLCGGNFEMKDTNWNTLVQIDSGGNITANGNINTYGGLKVNGTNGNWVAQIDSGGNITANGSINGGNISASGNMSANGGFGVNGTNGGWAAQIDSGGNISASGNVNVNNLNVTSGIIALGAYPDWSLIYSDDNGGLSVEANTIGETAVDPSGITTTGEINVNNGTVTISPNGDIHANWFNGLGVNASIGVTCAYLTASGVVSGQSFVTTSDRNLKEKFTPIDSREVLERVAGLPITRWNFKNDPASPHIGPMAQDFYAAFNVGTDDKHIATVDEDGVALAAIQGLNEKLKEKDARIEALEKRLADLEQLVKTSPQK